MNLRRPRPIRSLLIGPVVGLATAMLVVPAAAAEAPTACPDSGPCVIVEWDGGSAVVDATMIRDHADVHVTSYPTRDGAGGSSAVQVGGGLSVRGMIALIGQDPDEVVLFRAWPNGLTGQTVLEKETGDLGAPSPFADGLEPVFTVADLAPAGETIRFVRPQRTSDDVNEQDSWMTTGVAHVYLATSGRGLTTPTLTKGPTEGPKVTFTAGVDHPVAPGVRYTWILPGGTVSETASGRLTYVFPAAGGPFAVSVQVWESDDSWGTASLRDIDIDLGVTPAPTAPAAGPQHSPAAGPQHSPAASPSEPPLLANFPIGIATSYPFPGGGTGRRMAPLANGGIPELTAPAPPVATVVPVRVQRPPVRTDDWLRAPGVIASMFLAIAAAEGLVLRRRLRSRSRTTANGQ